RQHGHPPQRGRYDHQQTAGNLEHAETDPHPAREGDGPLHQLRVAEHFVAAAGQVQKGKHDLQCPHDHVHRLGSFCMYDGADDTSVTDTLAGRFEVHRAHARALAYRMLGSLAEAEDAVQESWLRLSRADGTTVTNLRGWLTTVVGRICLDMLRTRSSRREDPLDTFIPA